MYFVGKLNCVCWWFWFRNVEDRVKERGVKIDYKVFDWNNWLDVGVVYLYKKDYFEYG